MLNIAIYLNRSHQLRSLPPAERSARQEQLLQDFIAEFKPRAPDTTTVRERSTATDATNRASKTEYVSMRVNNLPDSTLPADVQALFSQCGDVGSVELAPAPKSGTETALVEMPARDAELALRRLNGHKFRNHELTVGLAA